MIKDGHDRRPTPDAFVPTTTANGVTKQSVFARGQVDELKTAVEQIRAEMESMKRRLLGPKTEKIKPIGREVREKRRRRPSRRASEARLARMPSCARPVSSPSASSTRSPRLTAPAPSAATATSSNASVGVGKPSVDRGSTCPATFVDVVHVRETLACPCGQHMVAAQGPGRVGDRACSTARASIAFIVVAKCGDSIPVYRLEKQLPPPRESRSHAAR